MKFTPEQKNAALSFARYLAKRDYTSALALCSEDIASRTDAEALADDFESVVPPDWGEIDPIEAVENEALPFLYVVLGGDVISEAIVIDSFVIEDGQTRIASFQLGRP